GPEHNRNLPTPNAGTEAEMNNWRGIEKITELSSLQPRRHLSAYRASLCHLWRGKSSWLSYLFGR
ncbi:MAG: hypothetical protein P8P84_22165, partial [Paracoccaceae bacterium]|nr:hypothetical protein [Paracoccaceae bacterium]